MKRDWTHGTEKITNEEIRQRVNIQSIVSEIVRSRRWKWIGHVLSMERK